MHKEFCEQIRKNRPLIHCITNMVTVNDCANILLAAGASPTMAMHELEVAEVSSHANALVCNLGATLQYEAMLTAAKTAKATKKEPVKPEIIVQYQNNEVDTAKVEERVKAQFVSEGHKAGFIKKLNIYIKPEEYSAYYVINDKFSGRVDLF